MNAFSARDSFASIDSPCSSAGLPVKGALACLEGLEWTLSFHTCLLSFYPSLLPPPLDDPSSSCRVCFSRDTRQHPFPSPFLHFPVALVLLKRRRLKCCFKSAKTIKSLGRVNSLVGGGRDAAWTISPAGVTGTALAPCLSQRGLLYQPGF